MKLKGQRPSRLCVGISSTDGPCHGCAWPLSLTGLGFPFGKMIRDL